MRERDWAANAALNPKQISPRSHRRVTWSCNIHSTWVARVKNRVAGTGCPGCAIEKRGRRRVHRGMLRDEYPELVKQLHPTNNAHINLDKVTSGSQGVVLPQVPG